MSADTSAPAGFLAGYRVLDLSDERGLIAGRILADLGADVVQVEPPEGSRARTVAPRSATGASLHFDTFAANKRGVALDLYTDAGRADFRRLVAVADVLIDSSGPGALDALDLGWPQLHALNPRLIQVSISAFGSSGPKADWVASDLTVWAAGGPLHPHREGDRPPLRPSIPQAFLHAGADAAGGALFALLARARTGRGQHVDVSAQASLGLATLAVNLCASVGDVEPDWDARTPGADQSGSGSGTPSAWKKWSCADGMIEFHIGMGPAVGGFTNSFFTWMVAEGAMETRFTEIDWRTVPEQLRAGTFDLTVLDDARMAVAAFLRCKSQHEILRAATDRKLLCVPVFDTANVAASEQLGQRDFWVEVGTGDRHRRLPGRFAAASASSPLLALTRPAPLIGEHTAEVLAEWGSHDATDATASAGSAWVINEPLPLVGLKVLDLSWVVAGPVIGRALADFGATVVRVESATRTETARRMPPFYGGKRGKEASALYGTCNAGKLGLALDLSTPAGQDVARDLARWSDVVVESFSPGLLTKWGLDYPALSAGRDDLIMLSTSIMGQTGRHSRLAGYGNVGAALSGFQDIVGWPDHPPLGPFGPYTDYVGPRFALATLLAALDRRERTGAGCYLDVAQVEAGVYFQSPELAQYFLDGTITHRLGNEDRDFAPHGVYPAQPDEHGDRFIALAVETDAQWLALATALERDDLATDPRVSTAAGRWEHRTELNDAVAQWTSVRPVEQSERILQDAGVAAHRSASSYDIADDPQLRHRQHLITLPHREFGTVTVEGPRYLLSDTPGRVERPAPMYGQDRDLVLGELLGYSPDRISQLDNDGVLR